jgi:molybdopterin-guanine dinucleotide biosynthesis protein A
MMVSPDSIAVVLLAGGRARRFPGKLEQRIAELPMIAHALRTVRATGWPVYLAANGSFPSSIDARLDAPLLIDRWPYAGPLTALLSACTAISAERLFAVAADQPRLSAAVLGDLARRWRSGDEAVVPRHERGIEPLAALYARAALLREGRMLRRLGRCAMHDLLERIATRFVTVDGQYFHNVNTPADVAAAFGVA